MLTSLMSLLEQRSVIKSKPSINAKKMRALSVARQRSNMPSCAPHSNNTQNSMRIYNQVMMGCLDTWGDGGRYRSLIKMSHDHALISLSLSLSSLRGYLPKWVRPWTKAVWNWSFLQHEELLAREKGEVCLSHWVPHEFNSWVSRWLLGSS